MCNDKTRRIFRGDIFFANLGEPYGSEQSGVRPVAVVQNDMGNRHSTTLVVIPLTSVQKKTRLPTHIYVGKCFGLQIESMALVEQITTIDRCRLHDYIGHINYATMKRLEAAILISVGIENGGEHRD